MLYYRNQYLGTGRTEIWRNDGTGNTALGETERYAGEQARYNSILVELSAWLRRQAKPKRGAQWRW